MSADAEKSIEAIGLSLALSRAKETCTRIGIPIANTVDAFGTIAAFHKTLPILEARGEADLSQQMIKHLTYFAEKAGIEITQIPLADTVIVPFDVLCDVINNCADVLAKSTDKACNVPATSDLPSEILAVIERAEQQLHGWCWREKSIALVNLILALRPEICVEIGVFGGRSAVPCAAALRYIGNGSLYAIESWNNSIAVEYATSEENDTWWRNCDFRPLKADFLRFIAENDLAMQTKIIEIPSARAAIFFDRIDFLHIDGAHSIINAAEDVIYYATKVRKDGIIILDDVNWETTGPALEILKEMCGPPEFVKDPTEVYTFAIFRRR